MTLCMAAACKEGNKKVIVLSADARAEKAWAGGNVAMKLGWADVGWPALFAGEVSKAEDFLATCNELLDSKEFNLMNIFDKLNEVSCAHKKKLVERFVQQKLGISYERFLAEGEHELTPEVRTQLMYDIVRLDFGCSLLVAGFITGQTYIYSIDGDGEVTLCQNFSAIGSGAVIAESTLYQREQTRHNSVETTLYNLYEASELARIAPGVGETSLFCIAEPAPKVEEGVGVRLVSEDYLKLLAKQFKKSGPKPVGRLPKVQIHGATDLKRSDSEKSEGQQ